MVLQLDSDALRDVVVLVDRRPQYYKFLTPGFTESGISQDAHLVSESERGEYWVAWVSDVLPGPVPAVQ